MSESNNAKNETSSSPTITGEIRVDVFGRTDVGLVREHNEDNFLIADLTEGNRNIKPEVRQHTVGKNGSIFVVCDGMGGAAAGEVASQIAVDTIYNMMQKGEPPKSEEALAQRLEKAICEAGRRILTAAKLNRSQRGMGTTVTAAALIGPRLIVGQVGDSRAYILRGQQFVQITKDQSLVQQLIDAKQMTEEEARSFDKNNIILQALGTSEEVHVDITSVVLKNGDKMVLCSDGLCGLVDNETIGQVVYDALNPLEACRVLTESACEAGGYDNITVIVSAFEGDTLKTAPEDGTDDETLQYERYAFSRTEISTARKMRPSKDSNVIDDDEEDDESSEVRGSTPTTERTEIRKNADGVNLSLFGAVGVLLLMLVGIIGYFALGGAPSDDAETETSETPSAVVAPPEQPVTVPQSETNSPPPSPSKVSTPVPAPATPSQLATHGDADKLPELAPTPEEAITKKAKGQGEKSKKETSPATAAPPVNAKKDPTEDLSKNSGSASDEPSAEEMAAGGDEALPDDEPPQLKLSPPNPYNEKNDKKENAGKQPQKTSEDTEGKSAPPKAEGDSPKVIDDNPFSGT